MYVNSMYICIDDVIIATLPNLYLQLKSLGVSATAVTRLLPLLQM